MTKEEFSKIDKFGVGEPNEAFAKYFIGQSFLKPLGASVGVYRVNRGGGFNDFGKHLRSAYRLASNPLTKDRNLGFRIARNAGKRNAISADGNGKNPAMKKLTLWNLKCRIRTAAGSTM